MAVHVKTTGPPAKAIVTGVSICFMFTIVFYLASAEFLISFVASIFIATIFYLFASHKETAGNLFHPYSYFIIVHGLFYYGMPVAVVILNPTNPYVLLMPLENLAIVIILVTGAFISYGVGYRSSIGRQMARMVPLFCFKKRVSREWFIVSALVLYSVGWLARIVAWRLGFHHMNPNLGEFTMVVSSVLSPLSMFSTLSFVVLLWDHFSHAKRNHLLFPFSWLVIILILLEVGAGLIQGSRSRMIFPLVFVAVVYNYTVRRLSVRHLLLGAIILVGVLAPAATVYRSIYFDTLDGGGASVAGASESFERFSESAPELQIVDEIEIVLGHLTSHLEGALVIYDKVPSEEAYAMGSTFIPSALLNFVPRIVWADKPIIMPGRQFAEMFWGRNIGEVYAVNMDIGLVGEAYYNFGLLGVLLIPAVFGIVLRFFVVRLEDYSRIEVHWGPRLFFVVFTVNAIGVFHYYPAEVIRSALFVLLFLSILNRGLPQVVRRGRLRAYHQRLVDRPSTPL